MAARQLGIPGIAGLMPGELIADLFAGGGGASEGIEEGLGRPPDVAINHDPAAIAMHMAIVAANCVAAVAVRATA